METLVFIAVLTIALWVAGYIPANTAGFGKEYKMYSKKAAKAAIRPSTEFAGRNAKFFWGLGIGTLLMLLLFLQ